MQDAQNAEPLFKAESVQEVTIQGSNSTVTYVRKESEAVMLNKGAGKEGFTKTQSIFELVFEMMGIKDQPTSKEIGTLILLGVMFLLLIISVTGFCVMWFTEYYNNTVLSNIILANNSETAQQWVDPNPKFDTLLKVHIFNYTNMDRYLLGLDSKIQVQDVGPLTYKEHTRKVAVSFNPNYTVTFRDHRSYEFLPDKSACEEFDKFVVPNVPLMTAAVKVDNMNFLKRLAALNIISMYNENVFKTLTAHSFLWGYPDRIVQLDFGTGNTHFGLLMNRNGTSVDSLQINTGEDDIRKFSTISQFNGMPALNFWTEDECNRIDGSDASMFPPHMLESRQNLYVFLQVLCRKVPLQFEKEATILNNIEVLRYRTPLNVFSRPEENPENSCYCHNTKLCMPSGVINATECYNGAPIFPSFPHFFSGDPAVYENFEGIDPVADIHQTYADIHPRFAFPISGASRIQINLMVHQSPMYKGNLKRIKEGTILPLIWIEITSGDFTDDILDKLYVSTFGLDAIQYTLKYGTLLTSVTLFSLIVAGFYYLTRRREERQMHKEQMIARFETTNTLRTSAGSLAHIDAIARGE